MSNLIVDFPSQTLQFSDTSTLYVYEDSLSGSSWYSPAEEDLFRIQAKQDIIALMTGNGKSNTLTQVSSFGLENEIISREYTKKRVLAKRLVRLAVLTEQASPNDANIKEERIALVSKKYSKWSRAQALEIGSFQALTRDTA